MASGASATHLTIGSRGSQLALCQARLVATELETRGVLSRIQVIKTTGDHLQTASLVQAGGKGLFTKEIEEALLAGTIDIAVHSLKDLPTETAPGLAIAAVPERADARDAIVGSPLNKLWPDACAGTSSGRRAAQLRILRPDLRIEPIRGNVDTRLRKLESGEYDAIVLAAAGLRRLGFGHVIAEVLSPEQMCPAPGQGALGIQTRAQDRAAEICGQLDHEPTNQAVTCERTVLAELGGGCQLPIAVYAEPNQETLEVIAFVASPDGVRFIRAQGSGPRNRPERLGEAVARDLLARGADKILSGSK